ncbi:phospholipase A and acyltransferase 3-like [Gracilinanus agilis]|uniref:phospholipase A and acyltransferase 3-like n=1 Tax=Gracilinanus agilis TaxID=191870 RepID=UPI001CFE5480|nr:phospholipase A and acyltransferase 3-like [Gracilinanus agilis]
MDTMGNSRNVKGPLEYGVPRMLKPNPGDVIEFREEDSFSDYFSHWGIYIGFDFVIHLVINENPTVAKSAKVEGLLLSTLKRMKYRINNKYDGQVKPLPPEEIVQKAKSMLNKTVPYSFLFNNCEDFVFHLRYGKLVNFWCMSRKSSSDKKKFSSDWCSSDNKFSGGWCSSDNRKFCGSWCSSGR